MATDIVYQISTAYDRQISLGNITSYLFCVCGSKKRQPISRLSQNLERMTRLELATSTLARWRRIFCFFVFVCSLTTMFIIRENSPFVNNILKVFLKNFLSQKMAQLPTPKLRLVHSSESKICRICSGRCTRTSAPYSNSTSLLRNPHVTPTAYRPAFFAVCMSVPESPT